LSRLVITLSSPVALSDELFGKHMFQSAIYSVLQDASMGDIHLGNRFRYFTFSDFFPSGPINPHKVKKILISSPSDEFIDRLKDTMEKKKFIYLGGNPLNIDDIKKVSFRSSPMVFTTGSPVVLYKDNRTNTYFSLRRGDSLAFFLMRIRENAVKRYKQFTGDNDFDLSHPVFDTATFNREVAVKIRKGKKNFLIIGTAWYSMERFLRRRSEEEFYRFLLDAGIGEKPSLGFGFLNPVRRN